MKRDYRSPMSEYRPRHCSAGEVAFLTGGRSICYAVPTRFLLRDSDDVQMQHGDRLAAVSHDLAKVGVGLAYALAAPNLCAPLGAQLARSRSFADEIAIVARL